MMTEVLKASNEKTPPEYRVICDGLTINVNGEELTIREHRKVSERVIGDSYAAWVILAERDSSKHDPWVVWLLVANKTGWSLGWGDYRRTEAEGREAFARR
jgi:hypothetical protein